jgi:hypothetical protein
VVELFNKLAGADLLAVRRGVTLFVGKSIQFDGKVTSG